jgi:hypothetical protein
MVPVREPLVSTPMIYLKLLFLFLVYVHVFVLSIVLLHLVITDLLYIVSHLEKHQGCLHLLLFDFFLVKSLFH